MPTHNKHISVTPEICAYFGKCAFLGKCHYFGKWKISHLRYSLESMPPTVGGIQKYSCLELEKNSLDFKFKEEKF